MKKENIVYIILVVVGLIIIVNFLMTPFWGNPMKKVSYYFQAQRYVSAKYEENIAVGWVEYDIKQSQYFVSAKAPKYDNVGFRVYIEKNGNKVTLTDDLCRMKWSKDIRAELEPTVKEVYGSFKVLNVGIQGYCLEDFSDVPNYFDVMDYVGGDVYISIALESDYSSSELSNVYAVYKSVEGLKPLSYRVSYSNTTFDVTNGYGKIRSASDLLNYTR